MDNMISGFHEEGETALEMLAHAEHARTAPTGDPNTKIVPVVLSGGGGSRLWPFSTTETPKQFLPLLQGTSLFRQALDRVHGRDGFSAPLVVGSERHAELCARELELHGPNARLILEPCARNTAPAVVMAAAVACEMYGPDVLLLVMPSDHVIEDVEEFHLAVRAGKTAALGGSLVTFGIRPSGADTGYGYLQMGGDVDGAPAVKQVLRFVEKPALPAAEAMVADGNHLWNAGIFLFRAGIFLEEARRAAPQIAESASRAIAAGRRDGIRVYADPAAMGNCESESIDYAVMERSSRVAVVPMSPGWSDLGSWDALAAMAQHEDADAAITMVDCESCFVRTDGLQVAALGVRDLIIVASGGKLLIVPRGRSQEVKKLLSAMDTLAA